MQVSCPSCHAPVVRDEIHHAGGASQCRQCQTLVNVTESERVEGSSEAESFPLGHASVSLPAGISIEATGPGLRIVYRWYTATFIYLACVCMFWDFYLIRLYTSSFVKDSPWVLVLFPLIHVVVGIGLTYYTLAGFVNHTTISMEGGMLTIRHAPLPWFGNVALQLDSLRQLYVEQKKHQGKHGATFSYQVWAQVTGRRKVVIISGLPELEQARFIEQLLETCLGIEDRPVHGENVR